ncbi:MAG: hypothetical protein ABI290_11520 [Ginsengibacter sp.]
MNTKIKKDKWSKSDVASFLSAIVSAIALIFATYQYVSGVKKEENNKRPIVTTPKIKFNSDSSTGYKVQPVPIVENFGLTPAYNFKFTSYEIEKVKKSDNYQIIDNNTFSYPNPLIPTIQFDLYLKPISVKDSAEYFFKLIIEYSDVNSDTNYKDSLYYKWQYLRISNINSYRFYNLETEDAKMIDRIIYSK